MQQGLEIEAAEEAEAKAGSDGQLISTTPTLATSGVTPWPSR